MSRIANALCKLNGGKTALAVSALCASIATAMSAQTPTTLQNFDGKNGSLPYAGLLQATNGDFYGTTFAGGTNFAGTVFRITASKTLTTIYNFCSQSGCADGRYPEAGLVQAANGDFYGTTLHGGANGDNGTVFRITPSGTLTSLYSFCGRSQCIDGARPFAALLRAIDGSFFGTTIYGGANGFGTVFKITPSGTLTTLYSFCAQSGCVDGTNPYAGLIQATDGYLYGSSLFGGNNGQGTIFKIMPSGTLTTIHSFCSQSSCADGAGSYTPLVQASDGNFYGVTALGGVNFDGTAFKMTPSGATTTLYSFCSQVGCSDGAFPQAALVEATDGNLYGTTLYGGDNSDVYCISGCGAVFKITPSGTLTSLYSFCTLSGCTDGDGPQTPVLQSTNGDFYGTTSLGGSFGHGIVFSLSEGLGQFVRTQTTAGTVGSVVQILGTDLIGSTGVSFNGTAAVFKVVSSSLILTTVPSGASSGKVQVVTPSDTLSSNVPYRVLP